MITRSEARKILKQLQREDQFTVLEAAAVLGALVALAGVLGAVAHVLRCGGRP